MHKTSILLLGPSADACEGIRAMLAAQPGFEVTLKPTTPPPDGLPEQYESDLDLIVCLFGPDWQSTIALLGRSGPLPPVIGIGPPDNLALIRRAMQAGVRDYLPTPVAAADLVDAVRKVRSEPGVPAGGRAPGQLIAVINVKGGAGTSFIAANLAHVIAARRRLEVGLLDFDLQFGSLPMAFDIQQSSNMLDALSSAEQLDAVALRGYMARHDSGVHVLSAMSSQLVVPWEISRDAVMRLLEVARQAMPVTVVDLARHIDPLTTAVIDQADRVLMVMQQSLVDTRDAKRMQQILIETLGVPRQRVTLVVNRFTERQSVRLKDIEEAVKPPRALTLPNDFVTASQAMDIGVPVFAHRPDSTIARALAALADELVPGDAERRPARQRGLRAALTGIWQGAPS